MQNVFSAAAALLGRRSLETTLVLAPPLAAIFWAGGTVSLAAAAAAMLVVVYVVVSAGCLILRSANAADMPAPAAWVLGVVASSVATYLLVVCFQVLAATAFAIWGAIVIAFTFVRRAQRAGQAGLTRSELAALLLCALATLGWCWEIAGASHSYIQGGIFTTWTDQFAHAGAISTFGDPRAAGHQAIELAGMPRPPYHYASYMLPAALAWPLDLAGLSLATSVWVPIGFLSICAGAYTLGAVLGGRAAGFLALAALTLLPDAASYGLYNRLFGFFWYVLAGPSASYAVGLSLVAIALLHRWHQTRDWRPLLVGACMVAALAVVRVHILLLMLPAWLSCAILCTRLSRERKLMSLAGVLALFLLFVLGFYRYFPDTPTALGKFLEVAHQDQDPTAYTGLYGDLMKRYGPLIAFPVGLLLVFPACLGIFLLLYPLAMLAMRRYRGLQATDWMPLVMCAWYLLLMTTAPMPPHGDSTEWTQRPFVVLYAVFVVWTAAGLSTWLASLGWSARRLAWTFAVAVPLLGAAILNSTVNDFRWTIQIWAPQGLPAAAAFIRAHWRPGDVLAVHRLRKVLVVTDTAVEAVALTGMPAYIARPYIQFARAGRPGEVARERFGQLIEIGVEPTAASALARLRQLGIQWYIISDDEGPGWDPERRQAAFTQGVVAVYSTDPARFTARR
ncbi:MAG TPA: hypothetical protein VFB53_04295 [Burkholderiales bacterium]|nr:hypothetical protein [Burkholderiales bacterium]